MSVGTGSMGATKHESCAMAGLVEAGRDRRLGARDAASLERHLATCSACRALADDLARLQELAQRAPVAPMDELSRQRGRLALLRDSAAPPAPKRSRPRVVAGLAAAIAAIAALSLAGRPAGPPAMARPFPAISFSLPVRTETTVVGSEGAEFERAQVGAVDRVSLRSGAIDARVRPLAPGERFVVATLDAEVEVRGTIFRVEAHDGHLLAVAVTEGKVEVRHVAGTSLVTAGESWKAPAAEPPPAEVPAPPRAVARGSGSARKDRERAFAEGVRLIERGDYAAGAEKLEAFRAGNPGDARAEDAAFLAIISLQHAGRLDDAAAAARRYLDRYPSGYRRAEAQAIAGAARGAQRP